jgi:glycosyltransferase involved in cell wall biosynthesis
MILIDAIYINNSGGKVLLDYLVECLEKEDFNVFYLFDKRIENNHPQIKLTNKVQFLEAGLWNRYFFYKENNCNFTKVLCFGNLPPSIKLNSTVYTYFHQPLFIKIPNNVTIINKFKIWLKTVILNILKKNTDYWIIQSVNVKNGLVKKYSLKDDSVIALPFYPPFDNDQVLVRKKNSFAYISNGGIHKNHFKLLEAFQIFYDNFHLGELQLTVSSEFGELLKFIEDLKNKGYPITNYGFIKRNDLAAIYRTTEFLIFPSLAESFGLGIVEAIDNGCKVIGSNLPYMHAVCKPSIVFNPELTEDICYAFEKAVTEEIRESEKIVFNEVDDLIKLLKTYENKK